MGPKRRKCYQDNVIDRLAPADSKLPSRMAVEGQMNLYFQLFGPPFVVYLVRILA